MKKVDLVFLEFIMKVEVVVFEEYMGDVMGDINFRCGRIEGMELRGNVQVICVYVLFVEMFGYVIDLRLKIQG